MARIYGKVSMEMWGDQKFCSLSPLKPSAQALWIYLLTGEFRTAIPGLNLKVGMGGLADRLKWRSKDVQACWTEIVAKGMAEADFRHGVVWLPKGIEHNEPESPNVIRGWGKVVLPECYVVTKALDSLSRHIAAGMSKAYHEAFLETFGHGSRNQEQEQEEITPLAPLSGGISISHRKPSKDERDRAIRAIDANGGCPHTEEPCDTRERCIGRIVAFWRTEQATGIKIEAAS